jgi:hypothetical protein
MSVPQRYSPFFGYQRDETRRGSASRWRLPSARYWRASRSRASLVGENLAVSEDTIMSAAASESDAADPPASPELPPTPLPRAQV